MAVYLLASDDKDFGTTFIKPTYLTNFYLFIMQVVRAFCLYMYPQVPNW